jgi:hypothetical protein
MVIFIFEYLSFLDNSLSFDSVLLFANFIIQTILF